MSEERLHDLLDYLEAYIANYGFSPSYRDMCEALGYQSTATVKYDLELLRDKGYVTWAQGKARSVRVV